MSDGISLRHRHIPAKKRLLLIAAAIITAMLGTAVSGAMLGGFRRKDYPDHTMLLAANAQNCPKTIETVYYLPEIPEGYELYEENYSIYYVTIFYENNTTKSMAFCQKVKEGYAVNFDNERHTFEEVDINGRYGLYQKPNDENDISGTIVWDNGDLVHLELEKVTYLYYDALKFIEYNFCSNESDIYDWYTGRAFPKRQTFQADGFEYGITLEIDGVPYDVSYSQEVKPNYEGWKYDSNGYGTNKGVTQETYIFKIPDGYDGLVFATVLKNEYTGLDTETVDEIALRLACNYLKYLKTYEEENE